MNCMRRLLRWTLNGLVMLSLLMFMTSAGLWVRSYWIADGLHWWGDELTATPSLQICAVRGSLDVMRTQCHRGDFKCDGVFQSPAATRSSLRWQALGFACYDGYLDSGPFGDSPIPFMEFVIPFWLLVLLPLMFPAFCLRPWSREQRLAFRLAHGLCRECGYDLRACTERCAECGMPIPADLVRKPMA
jgi:hypothetical protein